VVVNTHSIHFIVSGEVEMVHPAASKTCACRLLIWIHASRSTDTTITNYITREEEASRPARGRGRGRGRGRRGEGCCCCRWRRPRRRRSRAGRRPPRR
jgi:hypothetical protein